MYTSGRIVKSNVKTVSPIVAATREGRKLVKRHLVVPAGAQVFVDSRPWTDPQTYAAQIRTVITFPETVDGSDLACAVEVLPGVVRTSWDACSVTIIRAA